MKTCAECGDSPCDYLHPYSDQAMKPHKMDHWIDNFLAEKFRNHTPSFDVSNNREGLIQ